MKRGKDDEKVMGPMFPRLHVNDTEKGGPRAPPRNKMALYEQLSIPSQRLNHGVFTLSPSNTSSLVPPGSSSQVSSLERSMISPRHIPPSSSTHLAEKFHADQLEEECLNATLVQLEQRKKVGEEDDFRVPVFVNAGMGQHHSKTQNGINVEKPTPLNPSCPGGSLKVQNVSDKDPDQSNSLVVNIRKVVRDHTEQSPKVSSNRGPSIKSALHSSSRERTDELLKDCSATLAQDFEDFPASKLSRLQDSDACSRAGVKKNDNRCMNGFESMRDADKGMLSQPRSESHLVDDRTSPDEPNNESECFGDKMNRSPNLGNGDKSDDASETSMVDSISGFDFSPDDVVGIIGQKHFWKARRAIVNQQRVFAVQVFELHRLIKVQRLIAGSPQLMLEDSAYLGTASFKGSPKKTLPSEYAVQALTHIKRKDDSEKPSHKMDLPTENAVGRTSLSSVKNGSQPSNIGPYFGNPPPAPNATDNKMNPWCFHQSPGHQWLIPVMSPSEGLIYKPYLGPGFTGTVCAGYGPFGPAPVTGNFMTSAYGVPAPHNHHQGIGVVPGASPVGHVYFPPYGMPLMNPAISASAVEQMNQFPGSGSHGHVDQLSGGGANFNMQQQSSCNLPTEKNGPISHVMKSKDTELQGSTASSPGERVQGDGIVNATEGRNALPLFPMVPSGPDGAPQTQDADQPPRVIKVVPHNPRSATESAARIFQSIQEERKQYDTL